MCMRADRLSWVISSVEAQVQTVQSYGLQQVPTLVENMTTTVEAPSVVHQAPVVPVQEQHTKADPVVQQTPYFLGASNYPGFGRMPHIPGSQYGYEQAESVPQDAPRIPNIMVGDEHVGLRVVFNCSLFSALLSVMEPGRGFSFTCLACWKYVNEYVVETIHGLIGLLDAAVVMLRSRHTIRRRVTTLQHSGEQNPIGCILPTLRLTPQASILGILV